MAYVVVEDLVGKTLIGVDVGSDEIAFRTDDGKTYKMLHHQDCCESVTVEDVCGDVADLVGSPIVMAEEVTSENGGPEPPYADSWTWTFYKLATALGSVTIRWLGESNGYYSEAVDFVCCDD